MYFTFIWLIFFGFTPMLSLQQDVTAVSTVMAPTTAAAATEPPPNYINLEIVTENEQRLDMDYLMRLYKKYYATVKDSKREIKYKIFSIDREQITSTMVELCKFGSQGVSLIIDATIGGYESLDKFSTEHSIPYIRLAVNNFHIAETSLTYIKRKYGKDLAIIFQDELEADLGLYNLIAFSVLRVIVLDQFSNRSLARMVTLKPQPSFYVIVATTENMNRLFKMAYDGGLVKRPDRWILTFLDFQTDKFAYKWDQFPEITKLKMENHMCCRWLPNKQADGKCKCPDNFEFRKGYFIKIFNLITEQIGQNAFKLYYFNCTHSGGNNYTETLSLSIKEALQNSVDFYYSLDNKLITYYINMSIYVNQDNQPDRAVNIGYITNTDITTFQNYTIKSAKRFLHIGTVEAIPWSYYKRDEETGELLLNENGDPIWEGYCIDLMKRLSEVMEFNYEIVQPKTGRFGNKLKSGKWDGLIGDLITGDADITVAPLKMTAEREEVIDFIAPYFEQTGISIIMRKPVRQTSLFKFMTVLRLEVWLSIVAALIATAFMVWILDRFSPYSARNNKDAYPYPCREFTLKESFWFALTSFTPQGGGEAPKAISGRTLVAAYWLFVVLMLATFTANLAAFLTVERMQTPVQSLEQLSRQSRINYTVVYNSDTHQYFKNMKAAEDTLYRMWKEITLNSSNDDPQYRVWDYPIKEQYGHILLGIDAARPVANASVGFKIVNDREHADFAFIHDSAEIKYEISRNCNYTEVGEVFAEQPYALAVQQGSHLQDELSRTILILQKERFFESLSAKYWNHSIKGECISIDDSEGITLESLGGVFIATLVGLIIAMITLVGEVMYYRKKDREAKILAVQPFDPKMADKKLNNKSKDLADETKKNAIKPNKVEAMKIPNDITIGNKFVPANEKVSFISLYQKDKFYHRNNSFVID